MRVLFSHFLLIGWVDNTDGFRQIAEDAGVVEVERVGRVVLQDPREDRILTEVVVSSTRDRVEVHQVLEVADLTPHPFLRKSTT